MAVPSGIRQRGFAKWYERELLLGHSHLVMVLLCAVAAIGALEAFSQPGSARLLMVASLLVATGLGAWAVRRYLFLLMRAEHIASQAVCGECKTYGRIEVLSYDDGDEEKGRPPTMEVRCRKCAHRWPIGW